jgi:hypothetical protein
LPDCSGVRQLPGAAFLIFIDNYSTLAMDPGLRRDDGESEAAAFFPSFLSFFSEKDQT